MLKDRRTVGLNCASHECVRVSGAVPLLIPMTLWLTQGSGITVTFMLRFQIVIRCQYLRHLWTQSQLLDATSPFTDQVDGLSDCSTSSQKNGQENIQYIVTQMEQTCCKHRSHTDVIPLLIHTYRHRQKEERVNMRSRVSTSRDPLCNDIKPHTHTTSHTILLFFSLKEWSKSTEESKYTQAPQRTQQELCSIRKATHDYRYRKTRYEHYSIPANPHPKPVPIHTKLPTHPPQ